MNEVGPGDILQDGQYVVMKDEQYVVIKYPTIRWNFKYHKDADITYQYENAPCWFYRIMQQVVLGVVWERIKNEIQA
jgi:hypothetical protein